MGVATLYIALKRAAFDRVGIDIAGSHFTAQECRELCDQLARLMGESVALEIIQGARHATG
jgi:hypothetical protein